MMSIKFSGQPRGSVNAEVHFLDGDLAGLRLTGFGIRFHGEVMIVRFPLALKGDEESLTKEILNGYREWVRAR